MPIATTDGSNLVINGEVRGCFWLGGQSLHNDPGLAEFMAQLINAAVETGKVNPDLPPLTYAPDDQPPEMPRDNFLAIPESQESPRDHPRPARSGARRSPF